MKKEKSFTLIELLIVLVIVAILVTLALPTMASMKKKTIILEALGMFSSIRVAEEDYYLATGEYCPAVKNLNLKLDGTYFSRHCYICYTPNPIIGWRDGDPKSLLIFCCVTRTQPWAASGGAEVWKLFGNSNTIPMSNYIAIDDRGNIYSDLAGFDYPRAPVVPTHFSPEP